MQKIVLSLLLFILTTPLFATKIEFSSSGIFGQGKIYKNGYYSHNANKAHGRYGYLGYCDFNIYKAIGKSIEKGKTYQVLKSFTFINDFISLVNQTHHYYISADAFLRGALVLTSISFDKSGLKMIIKGKVKSIRIGTNVDQMIEDFGSADIVEFYAEVVSEKSIVDFLNNCDGELKVKVSTGYIAIKKVLS